MDDDDSRDYLALALDMVETGGVLLIFEERVGPTVRFGYYRGRWTLAFPHRMDVTATSTDRETVRGALDEGDAVEFVAAADDDAWTWLRADGTPRRPMYRAHCNCGAFKYSSDINTVHRWAEWHQEECYSSPSLEHPDET